MAERRCIRSVNKRKRADSRAVDAAVRPARGEFSPRNARFRADGKGVGGLSARIRAESSGVKIVRVGVETDRRGAVSRKSNRTHILLNKIKDTRIGVKYKSKVANGVSSSSARISALTNGGGISPRNKGSLTHGD